MFYYFCYNDDDYLDYHHHHYYYYCRYRHRDYHVHLISQARIPLPLPLTASPLSNSITAKLQFEHPTLPADRPQEAIHLHASLAYPRAPPFPFLSQSLRDFSPTRVLCLLGARSLDAPVRGLVPSDL